MTVLMILPFLFFWVLVLIGREELGLKGMATSVLIWLVLLLGCLASGLSVYYFVAAQGVLDMILLLIMFGGDIRIR